MANNGLPSNLYSGGAVVFNSKPYVDYYLQSMARKRAKDEALDNYFRDFNKTINPAGMRNQDIDGWMSKVNDWRNFYQQNKDAIKNPKLDNGRMYSEYMGRFQDLQADTQKSKNKGEISQKAILPIVGDPNKRTRLADNSVHAIDAHELSMYDPKHQEINPSSLDFDAKPFDQPAQAKYLKGITQGITMGEILKGTKVDKKSHQLVNTFSSTYNPNDLAVMYQRAASLYNADPTIKQFVDEQLNDPQIHEELNQVFKAAYGHDIDIHHPEDMLAAWTVSSVQQEREKQKTATYNPFLGMSMWGGQNQKPNPGELWATNMIQAGNIAAQTGSTDRLRDVASQLFAGNGSRRLGNGQNDIQYVVQNGRPAIKIATYPNNESELKREMLQKVDLVKQGKLHEKDVSIPGMVSTFYLDEGTPQLMSKLGNLWQQGVSSDSKVEQPQYYNQPSQPSPKVQPQPKKEAAPKVKDGLGIMDELKKKMGHK